MLLEKFKITILSLREKLQLSARKILQDESDVEDALQETFLRLWDIREKLDGHPNPEGYAMITLKNICIDKLKSKRYNESIDDVFGCSDNLTPYAQTEQNDELALIKRIIDSLPPIQQRVMRMRDIEGYELSEIAQIIDAEESSVRVNLSRARKTVRLKFTSLNKISS